MAKKLALYTALFGRFEPEHDPFGHLNYTRYGDIDRFYFTDLNMDGKIPYTVIKKDLDYLPGVKRQRKVKIKIPSEIFDNYEYSMWVDCRPLLAIDPYRLLSLADADLLIRSHDYRRCAYDEGKICVMQNRVSKSAVDRQLEHYRSQEFPPQNGLYHTGFMIRKHTKKLKKLMDAWWAEVRKFSHRDQISLPYVLWKQKFDVTVFPRDFSETYQMRVAYLA